MKINPPTLADGYKIDHRSQYPENTELVFSNVTARKTRRKNTKKTVWFGLQYFIKEYLIKSWNDNFFSKPEDEVVAKFTRRINGYLGPDNKVGEEHIRELHRYARIPLDFYALPEGTRVPLKVPPCVFYNSNRNFSWFTNYIETIFSNTIWGACTSATTADQYKQLLKKFALETVGDASFVQWQAHDFSFRGMFGFEAACISGMGHLTSFTGTDTIPAIDCLEEYYNANSDKELVGGSIPATEHSVMSSNIGGFEERIRNGEFENEMEVYFAS